MVRRCMSTTCTREVSHVHRLGNIACHAGAEGIIDGITDHRMTWGFRVRGSSQDCLAAFVSASSGPGRGGLLLKAKWEVRRSSSQAAAVYRGRAGLAKDMTMLSRRSTSEKEAGTGSGMTFTMEDTRPARRLARCG